MSLTYLDSIRNYLHKENDVCRNHVVNTIAEKETKPKFLLKVWEILEFFINQSTLQVFLWIEHTLL